MSAVALFRQVREAEWSDSQDQQHPRGRGAQGGQFVAKDKGASGQPAKRAPRIFGASDKVAAEIAEARARHAQKTKKKAGPGRPSPTMPATAQPSHSFRPGDTGKGVGQLQALMGSLGFTTDEDGKYGTQTEQAVRAMQEKLGMAQTGRASARLIRRMQDAKALSPCVKESRAAALFRRVREGHPYPGQRYRHGWIPVTPGLDIDSFGEADYDAFDTNFDARAERAIELYGLDRICLPINERLRANEDLGTAEGPSTDEDYEDWGPNRPYDLDALVDEIDRAVTLGRANRNVSLWRGVALTPAQADQFVPGASIVDAGFMSTSLERAPAEEFATVRSSSLAGSQPFVFQLLVKKGTPAVPVQDTGVSVHEIMLDREQATRVVSRDGNRIVLEVIG